MAAPSPASAETVIVEGVLDHVTYANEETAWSVVHLAVAGRAEPITAVGNLLGISLGESLRLKGTWIRDPRFGDQFKVSSFESIRPITREGIERFLSSGLIRGIGRGFAAKLVERFGLLTLEVIEKHPERLREVEGIGRVRSRVIQAAWEEQKQVREVMVFLQSNGVSTFLAARIFKQYGDRAVEVVKQNPYRLALEVMGIGFKTADTLARHLGIGADSPQRLQAGVLHVLGEISDEGHLYYPLGALEQRAAGVLEVARPQVRAALAQLVEQDRVVIEAEGGAQAPVYLATLHQAERETAERIRALASHPASALKIDIVKATAWFEEREKIVLSPEQREALARAVDSKVLVITGGPGTGKTTLVNGIIQILERKQLDIRLTAPTGRAAKRLSEATDREAGTLHRLLEYSPQERSFNRNSYHPLDTDLVVLDEASMVDALLAYHLVHALPLECRLILVGDIDQLPSVGPGSVLGELIRSQAVPVVRLQQIFRQAEASRIVTNAHRVNRGELPESGPADQSDFFFIERDRPEDVVATIKELVSSRIPKRFQLDPVRDIQVLTPMNKGPLGTAALNAELQGLLNPTGPSITRGSRVLRRGDKVMQLRNNYDLEVFNGDVGRILEIDTVEHQVQVEIDGRAITYSYAQLDELAIAYAVTIHKAQGSEYPAVVIPIHGAHSVMLARNLLYTALTRGRKLVVIVGSARALAQAVANGDSTHRYTQLARRLASDS